MREVEPRPTRRVRRDSAQRLPCTLDTLEGAPSGCLRACRDEVKPRFCVRSSSLTRLLTARDARLPEPWRLTRRCSLHDACDPDYKRST